MYLADKSKANVVNGGIGGTRWAQRGTPTLTPSTDQEAYAALDMSNLVSCWVNKWGTVDE